MKQTTLFGGFVPNSKSKGKQEGGDSKQHDIAEENHVKLNGANGISADVKSSPKSKSSPPKQNGMVKRGNPLCAKEKKKKLSLSKDKQLLEKDFQENGSIVHEKETANESSDRFDSKTSQEAPVSYDDFLKEFACSNSTGELQDESKAAETNSRCTASLVKCTEEKKRDISNVTVSSSHKVEKGSNASVSQKSKKALESKSKKSLPSSSVKKSQCIDERDTKIEESVTGPAAKIDSKQSLSYAEFLGLFKSAPSSDKKVDLVEDVSDSLALDDEADIAKPAVKCKPITSFFTKTSKDKVVLPSQTVNSNVLVVEAEIHTVFPPSVKAVKKTKTPLSNEEEKRKLSSTVSTDSQDDEIILLSSEIIEPEEPKVKKRPCEKLQMEGTNVENPPKKLRFSSSETDKKNSQSMSQSTISFTASGSMKLSKEEKHTEATSNEAVENLEKGKKNQTLKKVEKKDKFKSAVSDSDNCCLSKNRTGNENPVKKDSEVNVNDSSNAKFISSCMSHAQATISFGHAGGIKLTKAEKKCTEEKSIETSKLKQQKGNKKGKQTVETSSTQDKMETSVSDMEQSTPTRRSLRRRALPEEKPDVEDIPSDSAQQEPHNAEYQSTLRRSSRVTRPVQSLKEVEVLEVESDTQSSDEDAPKVKQSKKDSKKSGKQEVTPVKKAPGKLAPLFTKMKPTPEEVKKVPEEDPEKARLRREFLMSGVPEELKRQMAATASNVVELDYPPLPKEAHVQQFADGWEKSLLVAKPSLNLRLQSDDIIEDSLLISKWSHTCLISSQGLEPSSFSLLQKGLIAPPKISELQLQAILERLQSVDKKFPFNNLYKSLVSKKETFKTQAAEEPTTKKADKNDGEDDIVVIDDSPVAKKECTDGARLPDTKDCLWPDLYQPGSSNDVIGNSRLIQQLVSWLQEWKMAMQKEAKKANKKKGQGAAKSSSKSKDVWSDDSDFTDSEEEEDLSLCNTMLITGPHGIGKTACVYALAQEIGFKVFEVSASSLRSSKQLLAELEETTQSHRVSQSKIPVPQALASPATGEAPVCKDNIRTKVIEKTKSKPSASPAMTGFANLFRTPGQQTGAKKVEEKKSETPSKGRKRKNVIDVEALKEKETPKVKTKKTPEKSGSLKRGRKSKTEKVEETSQPETGTDACGSLSLTSSSLILFDEADIIFEDDKGFLATVQHFMNSTKIPIVLTATDPSFPHQLSTRFEQLAFKPPPVVSVASYLSTVCLANSFYVSHISMLNFAKMVKGDLRRALLHLQFWCETGGGRLEEAPQVDTQCLKQLHPAGSQPTNSVNDFGTQTAVRESGTQTLIADDNDSDGSDFMCLKPLHKRPRRTLVEEEDSNSSAASVISSNSDMKESKGKSVGKSKVKSAASEVNGVLANTGQCSETVVSLPKVHVGLEESWAGVQGPVTSQWLLSYIQNPKLDVSVAASTFSKLNPFLGNVLYNLALHSLNLPKLKKVSAQLKLPAHCNQEAKTTENSWKRILKADWLDSDSSSDGIKEKEPKADESTAASNSDGGKESDKSDKPTLNTEAQSETDKTDVTLESKDTNNDKLCSKVLSSFARFYDCMSVTDCFESLMSSGINNADQTLIPGLGDVYGQATIADSDWAQEYISYEQFLAARCLHRNVKNCVQEKSTSFGSEESEESNLALPIGRKLPDVWSLTLNASKSPKDPMVHNVCSSLGPHWRGNDSALHKDVLPTLREMCRSENYRQVANTKRRFHHYLDHVGIGLKDSTVTSLATMYYTM